MEEEAIVLRTVRINGGRTVVDMLTAAGSRLSAVAAGGKKGGVQRAVLQPMSIVWTAHGDGQLPRLEGVKLSQPYVSLRYSAIKTALALFTAEFLFNATKGEHDNSALYDYVRSAMLWLDNCPRSRSVANFHIVLMLRLTTFIGIEPDVNGYAPGRLFSLRQAAFTADTAAGECLSAAESAIVPTLMRLRLPTMHLLHLSRQQRAAIVNHIIDFYRLHVPAFHQLRSTAVLAQLW